MFVKHEPCPKCGSKDNLGRYSNGSAYCFGCGYMELPDVEHRIKQFTTPDKSTSKTVQLPKDVEDVFPDSVREWLEKYHITQDEIKVNNFMYSKDKSLLVMPVYTDPVNRSELLMWQGRYFGTNDKYPKYVTYGAKNVLHIVDSGSTAVGFSGPTVVVVEDLISAIKVGRVIPALPLWGSSIPLGTATRLSRAFSNLGVWLDMDKRFEGLKQASRLSPMFDKVFTVSTELDPKYYTTEEIKELLKC